MTDAVDKRALSLKPVNLEVVNGYIFVSVAPEPPSFTPVREMLELYSEPFRLSEAKVAHQSRLVERGNWKLVWENNRGVRSRVAEGAVALWERAAPCDCNRPLRRHVDRIVCAQNATTAR